MRAVAQRLTQFTRYADTAKGRHPSWQNAAPGPIAAPLVDTVVAGPRQLGATVETGSFGAQMKVALINDGPMTILPVSCERSFLTRRPGGQELGQ
jgi:D-tyrosyl-tRNA(Tyr) deacylase